jgi:hypothetical protein
MAAQERNTFVHTQQADAFAWTRAILGADRAKASTPVVDFETDRVVVLPEADGHPRSACMLAYIGKRLLRDPEQGCLDLRR